MKKYLKKHSLLILLLVIMSIFDSIATAGVPLITKKFIDYIPSLNINLILIFSLLFIGDVCFILFFEYIVKIISARLYRNILIDIKNDLFKKIFELPYDEFYQKDTDYYSNVFVNDVDLLYGDFFDCYFSLCLSIISFLVYSIVSLAINYIVAIVIIISSIITLFIPQLVGRKIAAKRKEQSDETEKYMGSLKDLLQGYSLNNNHTNSKFNGVHYFYNCKKENALFNFSKYKSFVDIFSGFSLYFVNICTFISGILLVNYKILNLASFVAMLSYVDLIAIPSRDMIFEVIGIKSSKEIRKKIEGILYHKNKKINYLNLNFKDEIRLKDVSFKYDDSKEKILDDVTLTLKCGKKYAIIGSNGSGKTTLKNILLGRIKNYKGNITYDGRDLNMINIEYFCSCIDQSTFIFNASGMDNVTLFGSYANKNLDKMVKELRMGNILKNDLGEFGSKLSGGEKRKIDILRSYARNSKMVIGDEIYENLDKKSEEEIKKFISENSKDKTWIEITHDLSAENLSRFDEVLILKKGKIIKMDASNDKLKEISMLI